jgi:hypothetical protein
MALETIVYPTSEPVSLADLKDFLRLDASDTSNDAIIQALAVAAREWAEGFTNRRFITQTVRLSVDYFPGYIDSRLNGSSFSSPFVTGANSLVAATRYAMLLPLLPAQAVVDFKYLDVTGTPVSMQPSQYVSDLRSRPARLTPPFGMFWPISYIVPNSVWVDYVVGYGAPVSVSIEAGSAEVTGATFPTYTTGQFLSIPGAGATGATLNTTIASVDVSGNATVNDAASVTVSAAQAWLGKEKLPASVGTAIKLLVGQWYENRLPNEADVPQMVKSTLYRLRDLRV